MNTPEFKQIHIGQNQLPQQVHLSDYLAILGKRKWIIIFTFLTIVGLVSFYSFTVTPIYSATAQILIEIPSSPMQGMEENDISGRQGREDYFQVIYQLLASRELASEIAERTNAHFGWTDNDPLLDDIPQSSTKPYYTAELHMINLRVTPVTDFGLISVSVLNQLPKTAAFLANLHAEVFIELYRQKKREKVQEKFAWFAQQINDQKIMVEQSYQKLHTYQKEHGLISNEKNSGIMQQKLIALNNTLIKATAEREAKDAVYQDLIKNSENNQVVFSLPVIVQDPIFMDLRNKQIDLREQRVEIAAQYGAKHSKMIELKRKETHLSQQLDKEVQRITRVSREEANRAALQEKIARQSLEEQKQTIINLREKYIHYDMLQREAVSNQTIYDNLIAQSKQVNLSSMFEGDNFYLTERASVPLEPAKPKIKLNILLAIVLSCFLGSCLAFFVEYMDKKVRTPDDVSCHLQLPVLGVLPYVKNYSKEKILLANDLIGGPTSIDSYSYSYLHVLDWLPAELQLGQPGEDGSVLLMESSVPGEGKTTVLAKIAVRLGKAGFRVLTVDCDFQRPTLHTFFTKDRPSGLSDALTKIAAVDIFTGQLNECSVGDLYILIELRKLSGQLTITNEGQLMSSFFENGRLLNIESYGAIRENKLGTMLLKGDFLTENQLQEALERNKRTGQPFGYILVNSGYITQEQLQGHLKLQTEEHLQKLFNWKTGTYSFESKPIRTYKNEKFYFQENFAAIISRQSQLAGNLIFGENINSLVRETDYKNVHFVAAGNARPDQGDPIDFRLLSKFIEFFRNGYDLILLDAPPVLEATDSAALAQIADGVVFVVKSGQLSYPVLHQALQRISATKTEILGIVLNQVKAKDFTG